MNANKWVCTGFLYSFCKPVLSLLLKTFNVVIIEVSYKLKCYERLTQMLNFQMIANPVAYHPQCPTRFSYYFQDLIFMLKLVAVLDYGPQTFSSWPLKTMAPEVGYLHCHCHCVHESFVLKAYWLQPVRKLLNSSALVALLLSYTSIQAKTVFMFGVKIRKMKKINLSGRMWISLRVWFREAKDNEEEWGLQDLKEVKSMRRKQLEFIVLVVFTMVY